ncbi:DUF4272 domain-containing protein [Roseimaritima ulvae]|uniref:DUF4272 domain-containing protein n=1 Tax=Roseimaritima ulvae TaxID=980254 RepID=A0A5B9R1H9_9BACT|nr:DUF4272 domain-containing protein [Roseimaritima ulvae]QEG43276.1 hypothetical protein UC8_53230 [Roseimaritima ulvae]
MTVLINAYGTVRQPTDIDFGCEELGHRDLNDPQLREHLGQFIGFIMDRGQREMTASLYAVMRHIERVRHHYSFRVEESALDAVAQWAWHNNAILFLPDSSVRDPSGNVLVDPQSGEPDDDAQIPFPADARQRKAQTELLLRNRLIDTPESLPPVVAEVEVTLREADDVAWRAMSLFIVAVRAESLATGQPIGVDNLREKAPLAFQSLSPVETQFLATDPPDQQSIINAAWRYEALFVLQWALGLHDELPFADAICDVPKVAETMLPRLNAEFVAAASLRPTAEILDALDFNQRLLWAARDAQLNERTAPASIDGGVISERQHALNWLVRFENADWDDVDVPS